MEMFQRIDSAIITESNKEYLWVYNFIKFYLKVCFYWLCYRTGAVIVIQISREIYSGAELDFILEELLKIMSEVDTIFLFVLLLILLMLFFTIIISKINKSGKK